MVSPLHCSRFRNILATTSCKKEFAKRCVHRSIFRSLHLKGSDIKPLLRGNVIQRTYHDRARGYLAGLHSYQPNQQDETETESEQQAEFESFESAWEAIQSVPEELLKDFEDELWETQSKRFVYGSKEVSVIDAVIDEEESHQNSKVVRYLVWNERPNLIQTAVEVPRISAPYQHYFCDEKDTTQLLARPPAPISQTHLGGLAIALPFWLKANGNPNNKDGDPSPKPMNAPNCLLIGAGGCSLAHTLAANLFLDGYNHIAAADTSTDDSDRRKIPQLTAVEASSEIIHVSMLWFGAKQDNEEKVGAEKDDSASPEPPFFNLVHTTGESYLESLAKQSNSTTQRTNSSSSAIDILIIDAEDGSAPPHSMRSTTFWEELVLPSLNFNGSPVIGVNSIGTKSETDELVRTIQQAFSGNETAPGLSYRILVVAPPPEAKVTDRHNLIFALPTITNPANDPDTSWCLSEDDLKGHVDAPDAWRDEIEQALQRAF